MCRAVCREMSECGGRMCVIAALIAQLVCVAAAAQRAVSVPLLSECSLLCINIT